MYNFTKLRIDYERDKNKDLGKNSITPIPGFIAGRLGGDSTASNMFTYSFLGRNVYSTILEHRFNYQENNDNRNYELYVNQDIKEQWGGVSFSHKVNKNFGFGITGYLSYRTQDIRYEYSNNGTDNSVMTKSVFEKGQLYYYNVSSLFKVGAAYQNGPFTAGLTLTTPNVKIMGSGEVYSFKSITGADSLNMLESDYQESLSSRYENSFALGGGFSYDFNTFALHTSVEWYNAVKPYKVLNANPFIGQTSGKSIMPRVTQNLNSIVNYGIGLVLFPKSKNQLYLSYYTDNSTVGGSGKSPLLITNWDLKHISAGSIFEFYGTKVSLGLALAWGDRDLKNENLNDDNTSNPKLHPRSKISPFLQTGIFTFWNHFPRVRNQTHDRSDSGS